MKTSISLVRKLLFKSIMIILITSCSNEASFSGDEFEAQEPESLAAEPAPPPVIETPKSPLELVSWDFPCEFNEEDPYSNIFQEDLTGASNHHVSKEDLGKKTKLKLTGDLCDPQDNPRDIVIVIDVSGSMSSNDPIVDGSCGRYEAFENMIKLSEKNTRYAIITFSDIIHFSSSQFYSTKDEMLDEMGSIQSAIETICSAESATHYDIGLEGASILFDTSSTKTLKELYFLSDGAPTIDHEGITKANKLKNSGTTIAAIMLKGAEQILQEYIASKDIHGSPLFAKASDATKLAEVLALLAARSRIEITEAELGIRPIDESDFAIYDILEYLTARSFQLPDIALGKIMESQASGIEVYIKFELGNGQSKIFEGTLIFD